MPSRARAVILTADPEPGASHGKLFARDVIYQIDATPVRDANQVTRLISNHSPGETLQFHLVRAGKVAAIDVELDNGWKGNKRWDADYYDGVLGMKLEHWDGDHGLSRRFDTPVITRIYSLGPAHQAHITSSQSSVAFRGPIMVPFQLDVKTVTGVVYAGRYHQATSPSVVETFARQAFDSDAPLLLEIELWARADPRNVGAPLTRRGKAFLPRQPGRDDRIGRAW